MLGCVCCVRALRQVPLVRLDCVDDVTTLFADCLSYMEAHLELGDSDDETSEDDEQLQPAAEHKLSSRATSADRRTRDELSSGSSIVSGSSSSSSSLSAAAPAVSLPAAPAVDSRSRLGLGSSAAPTVAAGVDKVPVLPPAGLATKLIGSTVTRDYSSPSQSKRSLGGGVGGKRGSITLPSAVNLAAGGTPAVSGGSTSVSPTSASGVSPTSSSSSGTLTLPPPASLSSSTSSSGSSSSAGSSSSPSSGKLGLGLGLKGPGGLMSSNAAAQTHTSSAAASTNSAPAANHSAQPSASAPSASSGAVASSAAAGPSAAAVGVGGKQIGLGHRPSSRAQYNAAASAAAAAAASTDDEELKEGASGASGPSSGQNSDTDDEVIRVARPLGGAPKNKLLHRAAAGLASREYPSPKLGGRSLGASPAGMGPRGMSAPNNQQQQGVAGSQQQPAQQPQQSSHSQRAPVLSHAASTGSAPFGSVASDSFLTQPPSLSSPPSFGSSEPTDVDLLPEPSSSLRDDEPTLLDDPAGSSLSGSAGGLILTEPGAFVKEKQLSDKEALNIPESAESEEKDLVDELVEKRPDPLQKLRNEVIVAVIASPKQIRSSLRLLTLAAESAQNADGTTTPPDSELNNSGAATNGTQLQPLLGLGAAPELSSHRLNPLLAASLPASFSSLSQSPSHSASNTPKPAFLRRLDSPESHHGQLVQAKAKLQMLINRCMQTIPQLKKDSLPAVQARLEAALAKLEASTIQP